MKIQLLKKQFRFLAFAIGIVICFLGHRKRLPKAPLSQWRVKFSTKFRVNLLSE